MSATPEEYRIAIKEAMNSLDDIFTPETVGMKNRTKGVILKLLHDIGFDFIKNS